MSSWCVSIMSEKRIHCQKVQLYRPTKFGCQTNRSLAIMLHATLHTVIAKISFAKVNSPSYNHLIMSLSFIYFLLHNWQVHPGILGYVMCLLTLVIIYDNHRNFLAQKALNNCNMWQIYMQYISYSITMLLWSIPQT